MKKSIFAVLISFVAVLSISAFLKNTKPKAQLPKFGAISDFHLLDQANQPVSLASLRGDVWIASFIFTRCQGPCPLMSQKAAQLQKAFTGQSHLKVVSISMDPQYDSPEVLAAYAEKYYADPKRWFFLTGDKAEIISLAVTAFKLPAGEDPDMHSTRFVLVDQQAHIRGYYDSQEPASIEKLMNDAKALAAEVVVPTA